MNMRNRKILIKTRYLFWFRKCALATLDRGIFSGGNFLINVLLARWLEQNQLGAYTLGYSIFMLIFGFHNALILEPMAVLGTTEYRNSLKKYQQSLICINIMGLSTLFIPILIFSGVAFFIFRLNTPLINAFIGVSIAAPFILLLWLLHRMCYLEFEPKYALTGTVIYNSFLLMTLFSFRHLGLLSLLSTFIAMAISSIFSSLFYFLKLKLRVRFSLLLSFLEFKSIRTQHWKYGRWIFGAAFVYWISGNGYYFIANTFLGLEKVGVLRALQNMAFPVTPIFTALILLILPGVSSRFARYGASTLRRDVTKVTIIFVSVAALFFIVVICSGGFLMRFLYGMKYEGYVPLLPLIMLPIVLGAAENGPSIGLRAMQIPKAIFWACCLSSLTTVFIGIPATYLFHLSGVAIGLIISVLASWIVILRLYRSKLHLRLRHESLQGTHDTVKNTGEL